MKDRNRTFATTTIINRLKPIPLNPPHEKLELVRTKVQMANLPKKLLLIQNDKRPTVWKPRDAIVVPAAAQNLVQQYRKDLVLGGIGVGYLVDGNVGEVFVGGGAFEVTFHA